MRPSYLRCALLSLLSWTLGCLIAQVPVNDIGRNPHAIRWKQINTEQVQVVFPEGEEEDAQRVADIAHFMWHQSTDDIGQLRTKISIFLHGHRILSNGLVTVGPLRSELFQSPPQMANSTKYLDLLAIHEYRHVQQFANATQGITKVVKNVLGSWAWGGMMAVALPRWYFEGDAVIAETDLSASGRGRLPTFYMQYHALFRDHKFYNYEKAGAGSFKDYVPSWYPLGYHMLRYGRSQYGQDLWEKVAQDAVRYKGIFTPFSRSLKKRTGLTTTKLYQATMKDLQQSWLHKDSLLAKEVYPSLIRKNKNTVTQYAAPIRVGHGYIISKSAYDEIGAYYNCSPNGELTKLVEHGILADAPFNTLSYHGNKIFWNELDFDPRWSNRQWSVVYSYDLISKKKRQLTYNSRYFSPAVSPDGQHIAVVQIAVNQEQNLVIVNAQDGELLRLVPNPSAYLITHPQWADDQSLIAVLSKDEHSAIGVIDIDTGTIKLLTNLGAYQLSHPVLWNGRIYFSASYTDVNNIFSVSLDGGSISQETQSAIGAFQPCISANGKSLLFTEFSSMGMDIKMTPLNTEQNQRKSFQFRAEQDFRIKNQSILTDLPQKEYRIKNYSKLSGLFNPHSLLAEFDDQSAEVSLRSDNKIGTLSAVALARFNFNEDRWTYAIGFNYAEFYPIFNARIARSYRGAQFLNFQELADTSVLFQVYNGAWSENSLSGGITLPYNFSQGNMSNIMRFRAQYTRTNIDINSGLEGDGVFRDTINGAPSRLQALKKLIKEPLQEGAFSTIDMSFSVQMLKRRARQHLKPRLGWALFARYRNNLSDDRYGGDVLNIGGNIFFPGIRKNHSLNLTMFLQHEDMVSTYRYGDGFAYPRGYRYSLRRDRFAKFGVNYEFPIWYPDMALGGLAFIKRFKGKAFYDHGWIRNTSFPSQNPRQNIRSLGFELGVDFRALRLVEVDLGLRYSYLLDPVFNNGRQHQFDFLIISITE